MGCLGDDSIARFLDGSLSADEDVAVRQHVDSCDACRALCASAGVATMTQKEPTRAEQKRNEADVLVRGDVIAGKYEVREVLGFGGMGTVAAAWHVELDRLVALKVMHPESASEPDSVRRFIREGRAAAKLTSENTVRIYDVGRLANGLPFIVMEHLEGEDLAAVLKGGVPPITSAVDWMLQACHAIGEAHQRGMIHRDIKPANLFLAKNPDGSRRVKVLDFGLAKELSTASKRAGVNPNASMELTGANLILGSPHYMAPEQIRDAASVGSAADIWALGATLHQLLTGETPFTSTTLHGLLACIVGDPTPVPSASRREIPASLDRVVARCLAKDPAGRYAHVGALADALRNWSAGDPVIDTMPETVQPQTAPVGFAGHPSPPAPFLAPTRATPRDFTLASPATPNTPMTPVTPMTPRGEMFDPHGSLKASTQQVAPPQSGGRALLVTFAVLAALGVALGVTAIRYRQLHPTTATTSAPSVSAPIVAPSSIPTPVATTEPAASVSAIPSASTAPIVSVAAAAPALRGPAKKTSSPVVTASASARPATTTSATPAGIATSMRD